jgi:hypothetical protein
MSRSGAFGLARRVGRSARKSFFAAAGHGPALVPKKKRGTGKPVPHELYWPGLEREGYGLGFVIRKKPALPAGRLAVGMAADLDVAPVVV